MFTNHFPQSFFFNVEFLFMNSFSLSAIQFVNILLVLWSLEKKVTDMKWFTEDSKLETALYRYIFQEDLSSFQHENACQPRQDESFAICVIIFCTKVVDLWSVPHHHSQR